MDHSAAAAPASPTASALAGSCSRGGSPASGAAASDSTSVARGAGAVEDEAGSALCSFSSFCSSAAAATATADISECARWEAGFRDLRRPSCGRRPSATGSPPASRKAAASTALAEGNSSSAEPSAAASSSTTSTSRAATAAGTATGTGTGSSGRLAAEGDRAFAGATFTTGDSLGLFSDFGGGGRDADTDFEDFGDLDDFGDFGPRTSSSDETLSLFAFEAFLSLAAFVFPDFFFAAFFSPSSWSAFSLDFFCFFFRGREESDAADERCRLAFFFFFGFGFGLFGSGLPGEGRCGRSEPELGARCRLRPGDGGGVGSSWMRSCRHMLGDRADLENCPCCGCRVQRSERCGLQRRCAPRGGLPSPSPKPRISPKARRAGGLSSQRRRALGGLSSARRGRLVLLVGLPSCRGLHFSGLARAPAALSDSITSVGLTSEPAPGPDSS
mmetsp:Transcript_173202/g.555476  ORF Transcript_173202/g.555476 Transcript_173202/m.555476 type:complete len:444 (+) Transcript_173202:934-2265(+)